MRRLTISFLCLAATALAGCAGPDLWRAADEPTPEDAALRVG